MVGEFSGHSGGGMFKGGMHAAKVVDTTKQKDRTGDRLLSERQTMRAPNQGSQISTEGAIESFNEGSVDSAVELSGAAQAGEHRTRATQHVTGDLKGAVGLMFDDLSQGQTRPDTVNGA